MSSQKIQRYVAYVMCGLLALGGMYYALALWFSAGFSLCGISGCSGGGYGVSYNPEATLRALGFSGVPLTLVAVALGIGTKKWFWYVIAAVLLVGVPIAGGMFIGADFTGHPIRDR